MWQLAIGMSGRMEQGGSMHLLQEPIYVPFWRELLARSALPSTSLSLVLSLTRSLSLPPSLPPSPSCPLSLPLSLLPSLPQISLLSSLYHPSPVPSPPRHSWLRSEPLLPPLLRPLWHPRHARLPARVLPPPVGSGHRWLLPRQAGGRGRGRAGVPRPAEAARAEVSCPRCVGRGCSREAGEVEGWVRDGLAGVRG